MNYVTDILAQQYFSFLVQSKSASKYKLIKQNKILPHQNMLKGFYHH